MKTFSFLILTFFLGIFVTAQTPQSFRYQAVARDNSGNVLANQNVSLRISILNGSVLGTVAYSETHSGLTTNAFGLVELEIGKGIPVAGTFSAIDWGSNIYFVKIEMDPAGGIAYQVLSTSQLLSVPYALHANSVQNLNEFDPTWNGPANLDGDIGRMGNVGIGTVSPTALLHTNGTGTGGGNVLFEGEYKIYFPGAPPVEGAGTRMMWYPDQAVFRMGAVSDDRWDAANLGTFSTAIGYNCVASGSVSFSLGSYTTAANTCAIAIGHGTQAWAYASTAMGYSTTAYGYASTAFGDNTVAQAYVSTAIGQYNVGNGTKNTWEETDPIFEIGIGRTHMARKNAMTVLKNGNVGIGTITPEAGLHIAGDGWPQSFVYLEAAAGNDAGIRFYESTTPKWHIFNDASIGGLMIQNNATTPAIYCNQSNAYVGIRTSSPTQALHVVGDAYKTSGGTSWATSSDLRLKYITGKYNKGLDEIAALQPVRFVYKENNPRQLTTNIEQVGFVAQEVQKIFPESVTEAADGYLDFNIHAINVALVNAVKELKSENERLKTENEEVKARLEKIEAILGSSVIK